MIIQQIPATLLIHSVILKTGKTTDDWGNDSYATSTTVNRVRVEPKRQLVTSQLVTSKDNQQITTSAMMYVDCKLSSYTAFNIDDTVTFNNKDYKVISIDYLYTDRLHHLEIGLI